MLTLSVALYIPLALGLVLWIVIAAAKRADKRERRAKELASRPPAERVVPEVPNRDKYRHA